MAGSWPAILSGILSAPSVVGAPSSTVGYSGLVSLVFKPPPKPPGEVKQRFPEPHIPRVETLQPLDYNFASISLLFAAPTGKQGDIFPCTPLPSLPTTATCGFLPPQIPGNTIHPHCTTNRGESSSQELHGSAAPANAGPEACRPDAEHQHH